MGETNQYEAICFVSTFIINSNILVPKMSVGDRTHQMKFYTSSSFPKKQYNWIETCARYLISKWGWFAVLKVFAFLEESWPTLPRHAVRLIWMNRSKTSLCITSLRTICFGIPIIPLKKIKSLLRIIDTVFIETCSIFTKKENKKTKKHLIWLSLSLRGLLFFRYHDYL